MIVRDVGSEHSRHRFTSKKEREQAIAKADLELQASIQEKDAKYKAYNDYMSQDMEHIDFMTYDSEAAKAKKDALWQDYLLAVEKEKAARKKLWSAKYDSLSGAQLRTEVAKSEDAEETAYIAKVQSQRAMEDRQRDLEIMSSIADPESVLYDPGFQEKNGYHSTKLIDGSKGESDTGYADIDYEFINGNEDISELIVGKERNYYKITEEEKRIYNYWHNYDREHGTNTAQQYLDLLQETLNARDSADDYAKIDGKPVLEVLYGAKAGLARYGNNVNNWYLKPDEYMPMTSTEMTALRAYEGLADAGDFIQINDKSLGQLGFSYMEDKAYNSLGDLVVMITGTKDTPAEHIVKGIVSMPATSGAAYRERVNLGYTKDEATAYGRIKGIGEAVASATSDLAGEGLGKAWDAVFADEDMSKLGEILGDSDWLGVTKMIEDGIQSAFEEKAMPQSEENMKTTVKAAVATKVLGKIVKKERVGFDQVSLDLRQELQNALQDPAVRNRMEQSGEFTKEQLDAFAAELVKIGDKEDGVGTYIGDYLYGDNGYSVNKHYLQPMVDQAILNRGKYINDETAKAIFQRYMPRSMW